MTAADASALTDDDLLAEVRSECARWEVRDDLEGGFARLHAVRDEALKRGLPLPKSCPLDPLPGAEDEVDPLAHETR